MPDLPTTFRRQTRQRGLLLAGHRVLMVAVMLVAGAGTARSQPAQNPSPLALAKPDDGVLDQARLLNPGTRRDLAAAIEEAARPPASLQVAFAAFTILPDRETATRLRQLWFPDLPRSFVIVYARDRNAFFVTDHTGMEGGLIALPLELTIKESSARVAALPRPRDGRDAMVAGEAARLIRNLANPDIWTRSPVAARQILLVLGGLAAVCAVIALPVWLLLRNRWRDQSPCPVVFPDVAMPTRLGAPLGGATSATRAFVPQAPPDRTR